MRNMTRAWIAIPALALILVVFVYPVGALLWSSLSEPSVGLQNFDRVLSDSTNITIVMRTIKMALIVTLVCGVLAYPYAYVLTRVRGAVFGLMMGILLMPLWTSLMARTFAWVVLLQRDGPIDRLLDWAHVPHGDLLGTSTGVTIGMAQIMLPFFALPLYASLRTIDTRLMDAAVSLGARPSVAFTKVYLPLSLPGLIGGASMTFVLSLGFYVTPALLGSPRESMVAQVMSLMIDRVLDFSGAGVLAFVMLFAAAAALVVARLAPRAMQMEDGR